MLSEAMSCGRTMPLSVTPCFSPFMVRLRCASISRLPFGMTLDTVAASRVRNLLLIVDWPAAELVCPALYASSGISSRNGPTPAPLL